MGMDDKTINDDEDAVMEVRMIHKLHRLATFDLEAPALDAYTALRDRYGQRRACMRLRGEIRARSRPA